MSSYSFRINDKVIKNPIKWISNDFDQWGRGIGIGIVLETSDDGIIDVRWPAGVCYESIEQLTNITKGTYNE